MTDDPFISVRDLKKYYWERDTVVDRLLGREARSVKAVDGISFDIQRGETLGLVGESGCGKSTTGETVLQLREATAGSMTFDGQDVFDMDDDELTEFRRRAQIVFQDPFSSLDPRMTIGDIVAEPLRIHGVPESTPQGVSKREWRMEKARDLLERVGLSVTQLDRYPHEFSGGQRQRIGIARALALEPEFIVLDEPVSALDVSVQAQVINLLEDLQEEFGLTYLFIAHDLSVVRHICDRVAVMYLGNVVELGPTDDLFDDPQHPYTEALLESVPRASTEEYGRRVEALRGDVPSPRDPPSGCRFRTRCPVVIPPDDVDLPQETYRAVMDLRERLESGSVNVESMREDAGLTSESDDVGTFVEYHRSDLLGDLPDPDSGVVGEALASVAHGEVGEAAAVLRDRYESVCETDRPVLHADTHPAACHLRTQPADVGDTTPADTAADD